MSLTRISDRPEWIDVKRDFGAKGDNTTDDLASFQSALNAAITLNAPIYVPPGTYYLSNTLVINNDGISIIGDGSNFYYGATLTSKGGSYPVIKIQGSGPNNYRYRNQLQDLHIQGQLYAYNCVDLWLDNVFVDGAQSDNLLVSGGWSHKYQGCQFQSSVNGSGIHFTSDPGTSAPEVNAVSIISCRIEGNGLNGITADSSTVITGLEIVGGIIEGHTNTGAVGISLPYAKGVSLNGVYFEANRAGNAVLGTATTKVQGFTAKGTMNTGYGDGTFTPRPPFGFHLVNVLGADIQSYNAGFSGEHTVVEQGCMNVEIRGAEPLQSGELTLPVSRLGTANKASGISRMNIAMNGGFVWGSGVPDGFTLGVGSETVTRVTTPVNSPGYACKLINAAGSAGSIQQVFTRQVTYLQGHTIFFGVMAQCSTAGVLRVRVWDSSNTVTSQTHPGDGNWHMIGVPFTVSNTATSLIVALEIVSNPSAVTAYLDDFVAYVDGDFSDAQVPISPSEYYKSLSGVVATTANTQPTSNYWTATTNESINNLIMPNSSNGFYYKCMQAGQTGGTEPIWPQASGATVTDGTVIWKASLIGASVTVTHNLNHTNYVVAVTPEATTRYSISKTSTTFTINTDTACNVDYVIVRT